MSRNRVVMKDIAAAAGVHQTTVSLALRNHSRLPRKTCQRIQRIAREMGYVPDPELSSLVSYRRSSSTRRNPPVIALVFDINDPDIFYEADYMSTIQQSIIQYANALGYKVDVFTQGKDFTSSAMLDRILKTRGIRGIIFGAIYYATTEFELDWDSYSMVKINFCPLNLPIDAVSSNSVISTRQAMQRLALMGFKRPLMAVCDIDDVHNHGLFSTGYYSGQQYYKPRNRLKFYHFNRKPFEVIGPEVRELILEVKPDVLLSNWASMVVPAWQATVLDGHRCQFIGIEADRASLMYGGICNDFGQISKMAVELLAGKMQIHQRGLPTYPSMTMIESKWTEPCKWPVEIDDARDLLDFNHSVASVR